jgi:tetratricopeptide (TPR) repeat protein
MLRLAASVSCLLIFSANAFSQIDSLNAALDTAQGVWRVKTLNELFRAHLQSDPVKAIGFTREALSLATEIGDAKGKAAAYNNLGVAYRNQGALDKALEYYLTSLKQYEALKNVEGIATTKNNIANLYMVKHDYAQAMKYLEDSHNLFVELKDQKKLVGSLNNLGNLYSELQLFEKATRYYSEAFQLSTQLGDPFSDPVDNMGNVYFKQGNYQRAVDHYLKALELERASNNKLAMLNTITNIGIAYTKAGQPQAAERYLDEARQLCEELQAYSFLPTILKHRAENLYKQNKLKEAYQTLLAYDTIRERVYGEQSTANIARMEMALSLQEKDKEYDLLKQADAIKSLELKSSRLFIVLSILGVLILIGSINLYLTGRRKRLINP